MKLPQKLLDKLIDRQCHHQLRKLTNTPMTGVDFCSNDYLGLSRNKEMVQQTQNLLSDINSHGATGSRLLSGNHQLYQYTEAFLSDFYQSPTSLIFNSGYDANIGLISSIAQRGDVILYDEYIHASIRQGIQLSSAKSYKFKHNDLEDMEAVSQRVISNNAEVYIIVESVYSMDGDSPNLVDMVSYCEQYGYHLIVDEAHGVGVHGQQGQGLLYQLGLQHSVFARVVTFGKALGCHGAAVLGSEDLYTYLVNFANSLIYTTGLPPHALAMIWSSHQYLSNNNTIIEMLKERIQSFKKLIEEYDLENNYIDSNSAIQILLPPSGVAVQEMSDTLVNNGYEVKAIRSPTVPLGMERLRFCIHTNNTVSQMRGVMELLTNFVK